MTQTQPQRDEQQKSSKVVLVLVTVLWFAFLAGILGYNPYMKDKLPKGVEEKGELIKETYQQKPKGVNTEGAGQ
jgi:Tfp pilus assembly protein PilO